MQLKSLEPDPSNDSYDEFLDALTITTDILSDPNTLKEDHVYFCDLGHVCERLEEFRKTFHKIQPCYPVECNDAKDLLTVLANSGVSFNCFNKQNVKSVCEVGKAKNAMFGTAAVQKSHLKFSLESGIEVMSFQSEFELKKLAAIQLSSSCRFIIQFNLASADGLSLSARVQQMKKLAMIARKKQLRVVGISLGHIPEEMKENMEDVVDSAISLMSFMESIGFENAIFDLGNCCELAITSLDMAIAEDCHAINSALDNQVFPRWPAVIVLADVGCILARSAFSLMVTVTGLDPIESTDDVIVDHKTFGQAIDGCVYINDSVYGSFSKNLQTPMLAATLPKLMARSSVDCESFSFDCDGKSLTGQEEKKNFCIRGKSGNVLDVVSSDCLLSKNIQIGDKLLFQDMGDFHCVMRVTSGNGATPPTTHSFISADQIEIAKRLKCKAFSLTGVPGNIDERVSCHGFDNYLSRQALNGWGDELTHSDFDVIFENIALLEQTHVSARHFDDALSSEGVFTRFGSDETLGPDDMPLFEQMRYQPNPFAFM